MRLERLRELALHADVARAWCLVSTQSAQLLLGAIKNQLNTSNTSYLRTRSNISAEDLEKHIQDAENLLEEGCAPEAEIILLAASLLSPSSSRIISILAKLYESRSEYSRTVSFTKELLTHEGVTDESIYQLSFALYMLGRPDESLEYILPLYIANPSQRISRLCGLLLRQLGRPLEAVDILESIVQSNPAEIHSARALAEIYSDIGLYQKSLDTLNRVPKGIADQPIKMHKAVIQRFKGEVNASIEEFSEIISTNNGLDDARWPQCFNYSIAGSAYAQELVQMAQDYWKNSGYLTADPTASSLEVKDLTQKPLRIGFLTSDIGDHVVSRFLTPLLRWHNRDAFFVALLSPARRFEQRGSEIASMADCTVSLQGLTLAESRSHVQQLNLDVIIDTNGFTLNSGLPIIAERCAAIQCHYIGYHATTGLKTIDYFLGDSITASPELQWQYTERLIQIPRLWMAYDASIEFPEATAKSKRKSPVFGAFSQVAKINTCTLEWWASALLAEPQSILVIKDKGCQCDTTRKRIEDTLERMGVDQRRVYFFGPVGTHWDHLDSYNAIDIALDTTPWSGATTAFEALGMGVPLVAICGDTTSSRMSTSVVNAAGKGHWIAHTKEDFARISALLAKDYQQIRKNKALMQKELRSSILFDEQRICNDFFRTISRLAFDHPVTSRTMREV